MIWYEVSVCFRFLGVIKVKVNNKNNNNQFIMRLFHKVFKGAGYSITHGHDKLNDLLYIYIYEINPGRGIQCHYNGKAKAQDTITHLYYPYCRQVPNLLPGWGEMCSQGYKPLTNPTWESSPTANFLTPAGLGPTTSGLLNWRISLLDEYFSIDSYIKLNARLIFCLKRNI